MSPIRPENRERYPPDWPTISDAIRFGRAGGRCECRGECGRKHTNLGVLAERCTAVHNGEHPVTRSLVTLTVAHLDHQPENSDNPDGTFAEILAIEESNLRAMCQRCHLGYDHDRHMAHQRENRHRGQMSLIPDERLT